MLATPRAVSASPVLRQRFQLRDAAVVYGRGLRLVGRNKSHRAIIESPVSVRRFAHRGDASALVARVQAGELSIIRSG
jgi:hypothetical protein